MGHRTRPQPSVPGSESGVSVTALVSIASAAREQLERVILPYWLNRGLDVEHGGFFTCLDNRGRELVSTDKFVWSQGRFVWLLARAAGLAGAGRLSPIETGDSGRWDAERLADAAERGGRFLLDHAVGDDGTCQYVVRADGTPTTGPAGETRSVYADCFVVMGLSELARLRGDDSWLKPATAILRRAEADIVAGTAPTPPYPIPDGYTAFGPKMILLNTMLEHARARMSLPGGQGVGASESGSVAAARAAMLAHRLPDGTFAEMVPSGADTSATSARADRLVARHRVPGHAIEGLWVLVELADLIGEPIDRELVISSVDALCRSAWDPDHGGLLRFVDATGADRPRGSSGGTPYEEMVAATWSTKLWWVHTETAYTAALAAQRFGDTTAAVWARRVWDYALATFPGGDEGEEWIQIRDRAGRPLDQVVALPVKDPFHIARNLMQLVDLAAAPHRVTP